MKRIDKLLIVLKALEMFHWAVVGGKFWPRDLAAEVEINDTMLSRHLRVHTQRGEARDSQ